MAWARERRCPYCVYIRKVKPNDCQTAWPVRVTNNDEQAQSDREAESKREREIERERERERELERLCVIGVGG